MLQSLGGGCEAGAGLRGVCGLVDCVERSNSKLLRPCVCVGGGAEGEGVHCLGCLCAVEIAATAAAQQPGWKGGVKG